MLSEQEREDIREEMKIYPFKRAACVTALKMVQKRKSWISDEDLKEIAGLLEMTPDELDSIATNYSLIFRRPVGRHVILLCDSVVCWICGFDKVCEEIKQRLGAGFGETTADGRFTLLPVPCLGRCDHAPALMIDDDQHDDVTPEKVSGVLESYE